jgi:hypothetical protein
VDEQVLADIAAGFQDPESKLIVVNPLIIKNFLGLTRARTTRQMQFALHNMLRKILKT